jgi:predicted dehydrogenase
MLRPASQRNDMVVTHIAARDSHREAAFASEHGLATAGGYEALIERDDIDLVYVAVPPSGHCEWSIRAVQAGKAVLCEKPFAMNAEQARQMVDAAKRTGRPLMEAFHYRFHPTLKRAQTLLRERAIGPLTGARASFCTVIPETEGEFRWNPALGGGAIMDLGCYPIHALRTLIGAEPEVVTASATYAASVEAEATATLRFDGGIHATIRCGMRSTQREWDLELVGARGRLTISNFIVPHHGGTLKLETPAGSLNEDAESISTFAAQLAHVADVLLRRAEPLTGGADAIANMRAIEAVRAAARFNAPPA